MTVIETSTSVESHVFESHVFGSHVFGDCRDLPYLSKKNNSLAFLTYNSTNSRVKMMTGSRTKGEERADE